MNTTFVSASYLTELLDLLETWGVSRESFLEDLGLSEADIANPSRLLGATLIRDAFELATERSNVSDVLLGYQLGLRERVTSHGALGFAFLTASTMREVRDLALRYLRARVSAFRLSLECDGSEQSIVFEDTIDLGQKRSILVFRVLVGIWKGAESLTSNPVDNMGRIEFRCPRPAPEVERRMNMTAVYEAPKDRIAFSEEVLDFPVMGCDPVAHELALLECERELSAFAEERRFLAIIRSGFKRQDGGGYRTLDELARGLGMSGRALSRELSARGTTYRAELESARRSEAVRLLEQRKLGVDEVAFQLGYADGAAFSRAFERWFGERPRARRKRRSTLPPAITA